MTLNAYPRIKVFFAFLLCPFFSGLIAVPFILISIMVTVLGNSSLIGEVRGTEVFSLFVTVPIMAQLIFLFPALALAISLVFLKVERKANVHWVISIVAATVSAAWMFGIVFFFIGKVEGYGVMRNMFPVFLSFVLGGISTWVAAYWSLPQRQSSE
ncbi:hypothetical protein VRB20_00715 [Pseudomonas poae]|uniref:hypothetical protein n=1 Tax=Pseudomonas poae TaxID=200451 RepID=UPI0030D059F0